jgi:putative glycerol-1-phosphate prenyltransferase
MKQAIYQGMVTRKQKGQKSFAVLIDPDKVNRVLLEKLANLSIEAKVDYLMVGGSLVISNHSTIA